MRKRIFSIVKKEFRQLSRDKRTLMGLVLVPIFMLIMFGYAISLDVKNIKLAVYDEDLSSTSRRFLEAFINSGYFQQTVTLSHPDEVNNGLAAEDYHAAFLIPRNFGAKIAGGRAAVFQVLVDGSNASMASTIIGYVNVVTGSFSGNIYARVFARPGLSQLTDPVTREEQSGPVAQTFLPLSPVETRYRIWFNPELKSAQFLVPGLMALIMVITAVLSTSMSIVREKEHGSMEQLLVSPVSSLELVLGKTIPYFLFTLTASVSILVASYFFFGITVKGSYLLLAFATFLFLFGSLGMGILISTVADSQQVAFMIASLTTMLPTYILSGFVFPIRNMPWLLQVVSHIIPARYFIVILRSIILRGAGWNAIAADMLGLTIFAFFTLSVGIIRLRREMEKG
jgi:ABC-2 type transport system permease protein